MRRGAGACLSLSSAAPSTSGFWLLACLGYPGGNAKKTKNRTTRKIKPSSEASLERDGPASGQQRTLGLTTHVGPVAYVIVLCPCRGPWRFACPDALPRLRVKHRSRKGDAPRPSHSSTLARPSRCKSLRTARLPSPPWGARPWPAAATNSRYKKKMAPGLPRSRASKQHGAAPAGGLR